MCTVDARGGLAGLGLRANRNPARYHARYPAFPLRPKAETRKAQLQYLYGTITEKVQSAEGGTQLSGTREGIRRVVVGSTALNADGNDRRQ